MRSATAPLGNPSRNTGSDAAVVTIAIIVGDVVSVVMTHAAATSFIHIAMFVPTHTSHSMRNVASRSGAHAVGFSVDGSGGGVPRSWRVIRTLSARDARISPMSART